MRIVLDARTTAASTPQAVWIACNDNGQADKFAEYPFQYRKRYGLHAISMNLLANQIEFRFNTASGMDCMQ